MSALGFVNIFFKRAAVIVTFNPDLLVLKESIKQLNLAGVSVLVVDNASSNSDELRPFHDLPIDLIFLKENLGIGAAQNVGLAKLKSDGFDEFILLDQDSIIAEQDIVSLFQIRRELKSRGVNVGILAPNIPSVTGKPLLSIGSVVEGGNEALYKTSLFQSSGSCFDAEFLDKNGFLDARLFIDFVDYEWNFRGESHGFQNYVLTSVGINHSFGVDGVSRNGVVYPIHKPVRRYYATRNSIVLFRRGYIPLRIRVDFCLTPLRAVYADILNNVFSIDTVKAIFKGVVDGILMRW